MKLLHVIRSVDPSLGGPVENIKQLTGAMAAMGHQAEVLTLDAADSGWVRKFPIPCHALGPGRGKYGYASQMVPWLRKFAADYDAVIVRGIWQYHSFACWRALRKSRTPYFVFTHGMLDPWFKTSAPLKHAKKWLYWPWSEYRVLRDAKAVLFTCEEEKILARRSFWLYRCQERVVNYGTAAPDGAAETQTTEFFARYPEVRSKRIALFLGRIHTKKGCDLLIDAYAEVLGNQPDWRLVIAGPDEEGLQAALQARAREKQIGGAITWTGLMTGALKYGALRAAEIFVLPSHQENFGIVVAESLGCGTPVLITNKVNIWREIEQDGAGLVADDNAAGVSSMLRSWLALSPEARERIKELARRCFIQRFEVRKSAQSFVATIAPFLASPRAAAKSGPLAVGPSGALANP